MRRNLQTDGATLQLILLLVTTTKAAERADVEYQVAMKERDHVVLLAKTHGLTVRAIAEHTGLSPARIGRIIQAGRKAIEGAEQSA